MKKPVYKIMDTWELTYDNIITDENGKVINVNYPIYEYSLKITLRRMPRLYEFQGALYLAPQCDTEPQLITR